MVVLEALNAAGTISDIFDMMEMLNALEPVLGIGQADLVAIADGANLGSKPSGLGKAPVSGLTGIGVGAMPPQLNTLRTWVDPNGYRLSDRVWLGGQEVRKNIDNSIRKAIAIRQSPEALARNLEQYLHSGLQPLRDKEGKLLDKALQKPGTITSHGRGTGSYPARRLARTELTRMHSETAVWAAERNPYIEALRRRLGAKHTHADACEALAGTYRKDGPNWPPPMPPTHPFCMCRLDNVYSKNKAVITNQLQSMAGMPNTGSVITDAKQLEAAYNGLDTNGVLQLDNVKEALVKLEADYKSNLIPQGPYTGRRRQLRSQQLVLEGTISETDLANKASQAALDLQLGKINQQTYGFLIDEVEAGREAVKWKAWHTQVQTNGVGFLPGTPGIAQSQKLMSQASWDANYDAAYDALLQMTPKVPQSVFDAAKQTYDFGTVAMGDGGYTEAFFKSKVKNYQQLYAQGLINKQQLESMEYASEQALAILDLKKVKPPFGAKSFDAVNSTASDYVAYLDTTPYLSGDAYKQAIDHASYQLQQEYGAFNISLAQVKEQQAVLDAALANHLNPPPGLVPTPGAAAVPVTTMPVAAASNLPTPVEAIKALEQEKADVVQAYADGLATKKTKADTVYQVNSKIKAYEQVQAAQALDGGLDDLVASLEKKLADAQAAVAAGTMSKSQLKSVQEHVGFQLPIAKEYQAAEQLIKANTFTESSFAQHMGTRTDELLQEMRATNVNASKAGRKEKELRAKIEAGIVDPDERLRTVTEYAAYQRHRADLDLAAGATKSLRKTYDSPDDLAKLYKQATPPGGSVHYGNLVVQPPQAKYKGFSAAYDPDEAKRATTWFRDGDDVSSSIAQGQAKKKNQQVLGKRMANDPEAVKALLEYEKKAGTNHHWFQNGTTVEDRMGGYTSKVMSNWAGNSGDSSLEAVRFQLAVEQEFGLTGVLRPYPDSVIKDALYATNAAEEIVLMRRLARNMYDETQEVLAKAGFDELHMHRGVRWSGTESFMPAWAKASTKGQKFVGGPELSAASSFAVHREASMPFAGGGSGPYSFMMHTAIPRQQILSFSRSGLGCLNEYEFVVLGSTDTEMLIQHLTPGAKF